MTSSVRSSTGEVRFNGEGRYMSFPGLNASRTGVLFRRCFTTFTIERMETGSEQRGRRPSSAAPPDGSSVLTRGLAGL